MSNTLVEQQFTSAVYVYTGKLLNALYTINVVMCVKQNRLKKRNYTFGGIYMRTCRQPD